MHPAAVLALILVLSATAGCLSVGEAPPIVAGAADAPAGCVLDEGGAVDASSPAAQRVTPASSGAGAPCP